jgi:hypothetical protein
VGVTVCGQLLFGLLAGAALFAARRRTTARTFWQIALIIAFVESFVIAIGLAALNAARGGSAAVTAALLWYTGAGWMVVQIVILVWWAWVWRQNVKRRRAVGEG